MADLASMIYGTAQQSAQNQGQGIAEGVQQGHELALRAEQLAQGKQQIEQRQQELQMAKVDKVGNWFEKAATMEDGAAKKAFINGYIPNGINALGLTDLFHQDSLKMAQSDPMSIQFMRAKTQQNPDYFMQTLLPAASDPEKFATMMASPEYTQFKGEQLSQASLQESIGALKKEFDKGNTEQNKTLRAQLQAVAAGAKQDKGFSHEDTRDLQSFKTHIVDTVNKNVAPLTKEMKELSVAQDAGARLSAAIARGESNYKGAAADAESVKNAFLRSVVSRVTSEERSSLQQQPGLAGIMQNANIKWGTGGFNPEMIGGVIRLVNGQVTTVREQLDQQKQLVTDEVKNSRWSGQQDAILNPVKNYFEKLDSAAGSGGGSKVSFNGKNWDPAELAKLIEDHKDDPKVGAARAALKAYKAQKGIK